MVLVVAAVALIVVTGGAAAIAIGGMVAAASAGTLTVGAAILGGAAVLAEGAGIYFTAKALYDYSQDGDEKALFKEVALGFLFLGAGAALARGARALRGSKFMDDILKKFDPTTATNKQKCNFGEIMSGENLVNNPALKNKGYNLSKIGDPPVSGLDDKIVKGIDGIYENATPPPKFVIDEAKFNTTQLGKTKSGKQMSDDWIKSDGYKRLKDQVGPKKANEIAKAMQNGEVEKVLSRVDNNGNVVTKGLDESGNVTGSWPK